MRENRFREVDLTEILPTEVDLGRSRRKVEERRSEEEEVELDELEDLAEFELAEFELSKFKLTGLSKFSVSFIEAVSSGCKFGFCSRNGDVSGSLFKYSSIHSSRA